VLSIPDLDLAGRGDVFDLSILFNTIKVVLLRKGT
jgi:hypothetical protein